MTARTAEEAVEEIAREAEKMADVSLDDEGSAQLNYLVRRLREALFAKDLP